MNVSKMMHEKGDRRDRVDWATANRSVVAFPWIGVFESLLKHTQPDI
jgi:hypothetical protein